MNKYIYIILVLFSTAFGQRADFFKEDITFRLNRVYLEVDGYYWFSNNSNKQINSEIFYPFPASNGGGIDSVRLYNISAGQKTHYKFDGASGITFHLLIPPHDTVLFQIGYRQLITGDSALYILKTTKNWGKPLIYAEYKLIVPDTLEIKKFSYQPDKLYNIEKERIYYWKMDNFMPVNDMIFYF